MFEDWTIIIYIIKIVASIILGSISGFAIVYVFNKMPAKWLCDYGQTPSEELSNPYTQRLKGYPWRWIYAAGFSCLILKLSLIDIQLALAGLFACWALLIIAIADLKYMIIPDQFVIMLALSALGFIPFHDSYWQPILGAAIGGGVMMITALLGRLSFKREVMGFGDVKLFASLGLALGVKATIIVLAGASICSGVAALLGLASGKLKKDEERPLGPYICGWGMAYIFLLNNL